jgi:lysophospholipase L1-like esterase
VIRLRRSTLALCILFPSLLLAQNPPPALDQDDSNWEPDIRKFEEQDKINPPKPGVIVFAGSSSFARWDTLADQMNGLDVINRGFGGSQYTDLNKYAPRIVLAYHPSAVVVYEGDNDLASFHVKTPRSVANEAKKFARMVHSASPQAWIYFLSIKPSKARWDKWPQMKSTNAMIADFAKRQQRVQYIDVASAMLDAQGRPRDELFAEDGLHPNAKCYELWTSIIKPVLLKREGTQK